MIPRLHPNYDWSDIRTLLLPAKQETIGLLEGAFQKKTKYKHAISFRYGRTGLYYLLKALDAKNKKVILPSYTCVVVPHAIMEAGAIPVFLDNEAGRHQPAPSDYLKAIDDQTVMIIPTNLFGISEYSDDLYKDVKKLHPQVFVLQDCAHSFFSSGESCGLTCDSGDGALFGMNISKLVNSIHGGMLCIENKELANQIRSMRDTEHAREDSGPLLRSLMARLYGLAVASAFTPLGYSITKFLLKYTKLLDSEVKYFNSDTIELPRDYKQPMLSIEAAIGLKSLEKYDQRVADRRKIAAMYMKGLSGNNCIDLPSEHDGATWNHFPIFVDESLRNSIIDRAERELELELGIIVDYSCADLPSYKKRGHPSCPRALTLSKRVLNLPLTLREGLFPPRNWKSKISQIVSLINQCTDRPN
jgi:dTDP-4-amino-4,6-dideoxygalactose transaminase